MANASTPPPHSASTSQLLFAGTYNRPSSSEGVSGPGIYSLNFDRTSGALTLLGSTGGIENPSYLCLSPDRSNLYAVWEVGDWPEGFITQFSVDDKTGSLTPIRSQGSRGAAPCFLSTDHQATSLLVANYLSGTVALLPIGEDGTLGEAASVVQHAGQGPNGQGRQEGPHAHCIRPDPTDQYALACDLGTDSVYCYRIDRQAGRLTPISTLKMTPGSGPRHLAFSPDGSTVYVVGELDMTITTLKFDPETGILSPLQTLSTLPPGHVVPAGQAVDAADIHLHPSGEFVYVSNRGHDTIAIFRRAPQEAHNSEEPDCASKLELVGHQPTNGSWPRNFVLSDDGAFAIIANQFSNSISVFTIDSETGLFGPEVSQIGLESPVCLQFGDLRGTVPHAGAANG